MIKYLGEIRGIPVFYDKSLERKNFMIGRKSCDGEMQFVLGDTKDLSKYVVVVNHYIDHKDDVVIPY